MPIGNDHTFKSRHNKRFFDDVDKNLKGYTDWKIISLFYSALHMVEAEAYKKFRVHCESHKIRRNFVNRSLRPIAGNYELLFNECWEVRYHDCSDCSNKENILVNYLIPAYDDIKKILGY